MKRLLAVVAMVGAVLLGQVAPATAETTGSQTFTIFGFDGTDTVIGSGVVSGFGTLAPIDDETDEFIFDAGTFQVNHPETGGTFDFNEFTCIGSGTFEGTYTLGDGTGDYAGISGSGTYTGRFFFMAQRDEEGNCSEEEEPVFNFYQVTARGTTTLP